MIQRLLAAQFPEWKHLPIQRISTAGTDNEIFRLGPDMAVRLPKVDWAVGQAEKEHRWLPELAPLLPLAIPLPLVVGTPACGYPWPWSVCTWIEGDTATPERLADQRQTASSLARFVSALHRIDAAGGPPSGRQNHGRGLPLAALDNRVRVALDQLIDRVDVAAATAAWETALKTPSWNGRPVWIHGDLHASNLLAVDGELNAVIDFGLLGVGDPAADMLPAWTMFDAEGRDAFRATAGVDADTWARGRGWAVYSGLVALPFYWDTNPSVVEGSLRTLAAVLSDAEPRSRSAPD